MPPLTVREHLDWQTFAAHHWDRAPVLYKGVAEPPFVEDEVFGAALAATRPRNPFSLPAHVQFTIGRHQQAEPGAHLPEPADASFDGYRKRLAEVLGGSRYALIVHSFHSFHAPQWQRERAFYAGLWNQVGQPLTGAITTLFHGTYEHSPVGVHRDRFATFMFVLRGRKRMRFWPEKPWDEPVSTVLDYERFLPGSFAVVAERGDLLYWPSEYYHVGESLDGPPATSVNVGVPRSGHHAAYELEELLVGTGDAPRGDPRSGAGHLPAPEAPLFEPLGDHAEPAPALSQALNALLTSQDTSPAGAGDATAADVAVAALSLSHWTSGGFRPVPPPAETVRPVDSTAVRAVADLLWTECGGTTLCAAHGHVFAIASHPAVPPLLARLRTGEPTLVERLLAAFPATPPAEAPVPTGRCHPATREGVRALLAGLTAARALAPADADPTTATPPEELSRRRR